MKTSTWILLIGLLFGGLCFAQDRLIITDQDRAVYAVLVRYLRYMPNKVERFQQPCYLAIVDYMNAYSGYGDKDKAWEGFDQECSDIVINGEEIRL